MLSHISEHQRSRLFVSAIFMINGMAIGMWASHMPGLQSKFALTEFQLSALLLAAGFGAVLIMPLIGKLNHRHGSINTTFYSTIALGLSLAPIYLAGSYWQCCIAAFCFGASNGAMDISMNDQAVSVEKNAKRAIMSSFHGWFSIGGLFGSLLAAIILWQQGTAVAQAIFSGLLLLLIAALSKNHLIKTAEKHIDAKSKNAGLSFQAILLLLALVSMLSFISEGVIADWGSLYLRDFIGANAAFAALAFAAFSITMTIARFSGDYFVEKYGRYKVLVFGGLCLVIGMLLLFAWRWYPISLLSLAIMGLGLANLVPVMFSRAGNLENVPSSIGIATVSFWSYGGFLLGPPLIGGVAHFFGLDIALLSLAVFGLIILALAKTCSHAK